MPRNHSTTPGARPEQAASRRREARGSEQIRQRIRNRRILHRFRNSARPQIIAPIPADATHKYPLKLALFAPISGYAVTLHTGKDRPERLVFWKVADDKYQKVMAHGVRSGFRRTFSGSDQLRRNHRDPAATDSFIDVATLGRLGVTDRVLHTDYDEDHWQPVEIESPQDWYKDKLAPSETVRHPGRNFFSDGGLEFEFQIWNSNDQDCCPTAGQVTGTYKIIRAQSSIGIACADSIRDYCGASRWNSDGGRWSHWRKTARGQRHGIGH